MRRIIPSLFLCLLLTACTVGIVKQEELTSAAPTTPASASTSAGTPHPTPLSMPLSVSDAQSAEVEVVGYIERHSQSVFVQGNYAYVGFGPELVVLDISDPAHPNQVSSVTLPRGGEVADVYVANNGYAYIAAVEEGLRAVDVSSSTVPAEVGFCNTPGVAFHVAVAGRYAYVAAGAGGLWVIDVSNPAVPFEVGSYDTPGYAWDVAAAGDHVYVADREGGLRVIDVSDPAAPFEVGFYDALGSANDVAVANDYAYVADWVRGMRVVDISDPTAPFEVGSYHTQHAWSVTVEDDYVYVADMYDGLRVVNISDPAAPFEVGFYETPGSANDVAVANGYVYVAGDGGVFILRFIPPADISRLAPTPTIVPTAIPTVSPTQTPTPCPIFIAPEFYSRLNAHPDIVLALGCPTAWRRQTWAAEERFQYGRMFWQQDTDMIHILYGSSGTFRIEPDLYVEGDPDDACPEVGGAPEGLFKPAWGFNRQWCNTAGVRYALGWALEGETGYNAVWQEFEHGHVLRSRADHIFVFYADGTWSYVE